MKEENTTEKDNKGNVSRREFLKYGAGVAAVAIGATAMMGKIPLSIPQTEQSNQNPRTNDSSEPIVATVTGDEVTVMNGDLIVKSKDSGLAALIADKVNSGS